MSRLPTAVFLILFLVLPSRASAQASCRPSTTALVLSGGGAKGIAHVGVIKALDRAGIRPDLIVGTSMGSIIGALYAAGHDGNEIDSIIGELPLSGAFSALPPRGPLAWGSRLPLLIWESGERGFTLRGTAVDESGNNRLLNTTMLEPNLRAGGDFDRLPIPLRVVATDLADRGTVVISGGDLAQAVRASSSIPLVFTPIRVNGQLLVDGGLSANIPVAVARSAGAERVIISDVTSGSDDEADLESPFGVASRLLDWLFVQPNPVLGSEDLLIEPPIDGFSALDFNGGRLRELVILGEREAVKRLEGWRCTASSVKPADPKPELRLRLTGIELNVADSSAVKVMRQSLLLNDGDTIDTDVLGSRLTMLAENEQFRELWLGPTVTGDNVMFRPIIRQLPRRVAGLGLSYDSELGGKLWGGVLDRRVPIVRSEGSALFSLARFDQDLLLEVRRATLLGAPALTPVARLHVVGGEERRFDVDGLELPGNEHRHLEAALGLERRFGHHVRLRAEGVWRSWREEDLVTDEVLIRSTKGGRLLVDHLRDDRSAGARIELTLTDQYARGALELRLGGRTGPIEIEQRIRVGVGRDLSIAESFTLGGADGFPGLLLRERPGDNELFASLTLSRLVYGPFALRVTGAFGRTAFGATELGFGVPSRPDRVLPGFHLDGDPFGAGGWLFGGRIGVGAETPIGPIRLEWGVNDLGRSTGLLRVGRWQ